MQAKNEERRNRRELMLRYKVSGKQVRRLERQARKEIKEELNA